MKRAFLMLAAVAALLTGCSDDPVAPVEEAGARSSNVTCVVVGMENSKRFGACPGCKLDSDRISSMLKNKFGYGCTLLQSESATRTAFTNAVIRAVAATPTDGLFILYYSGHGGQEQLPASWNTSEPSTADSADEYLCLYDTYLLDDEVWSMVSRCRGRVFMCFDACHSQTMFRSVADDIILSKGYGIPLASRMVRSRGFKLRPRAVPLADNSFRMLCWSGCLEAEYSFGSSRGGEMTNAILSNWRKGMWYAELWKKVYDDVNTVQKGQHPVMTQYGSGFEEAFR